MRLFVAISLIFSAAIAHAAPESKVFLVSDTHAAYQNFGPFLSNLLRRIEAFKESNPRGGVLIVFNGDVGGTGLYAEKDQGALDFALVRLLSWSFPTVLVLGNHEGLDFNYLRRPHDIFNQQIAALYASTGNPVLAANLTTAPAARHLFKPHRDFNLGGRHTRVVGIALDSYFRESGYDRERASAHFFEDMDPRGYLDTMKEEALKAAEDGVDTVLFAIHDGGEKLRPVAREFNEWKLQQPELVLLKTPLVMGGHMHSVVNAREGFSRVVEAGSDLAFSEISLEGGAVTDVTHWSTGAQEGMFDEEDDGLPSEYLLLTEIANAYVAETDAENAHVLSRPLRAAADRRENVGAMLATLIREWAVDEVAAGALGNPAPIAGVVGLYNTLSYGWGPKIDALYDAPVTAGTLKSLVHFRGNLGLRLMTGRQLLRFIRSMREYGARSSRPFTTPLISANVEEMDGLFFIRGEEGGLDIIGDNDVKTYAVATDHFLANNGYKVPGVDEAFRGAPRATHGNRPTVNAEVLLDYWQKLQQESRGCATFLGAFTK